MIPQRDLGRRFARGEDPEKIPAASNIEAEPSERDDDFEAYLIGYNWAIYAGRRPDGSIVLFRGWSGFSRTTTAQLSSIYGGMLTVLAGSSIDVDDEVRPKIRPKSRARTNHSRPPRRSDLPA